MISIDPSALQYTNNKWMNNPFHIGEITLQQHYKIQDHVMSYAPKFIRSYMPIEHQQFYTDLPFLVAAIRDTNDNMWATLLENNDIIDVGVDEDGILHKEQLVTLPTSKTLQIHARPVHGDALEGIFDSTQNIGRNKKSIDVGLLGIQFETARRNRVNGRIFITDDDHDNGSTSLQPLLFQVDQSFGNCPQYIKPRQQWYRSKSTTTTASPTSNNDEKQTTKNVKSFPTRLTTKQIEWIHTAETFFTATGYRNYNDTNNEDHMQYGNDASHRGGPPGFVRVIDADLVEHNNDNRATGNSIHQQQIMWTEFNGNKHFNSLGNLLLDPRIGLCFPNFENGSMLQISGVAILDMGDVQTGARQVRVQIQAINEVPAGSLPIRWGSKQTNDNDGDSKVDGYTTMQITKIVQESDDVKSFYIQPLPSSKKIGSSVIKHQAGQHLPIRLVLDNGEVIDRRYSLSSNPNTSTTTSAINDVKGYYRISVKHHKNGKSSSYLHSDMNVGSIIKVGKPGGTFTIQQPGVEISKMTPVVLISAGIGITPLLSMLYELAEKPQNERMIYWFHGARNKQQHPFQYEIDQIYQSLSNKDLLQIHTFYSTSSDSVNDDQINEKSVQLQSGRITSQYVQEMIPNIRSASIYICGPSSFIADISTGLEEYGGRYIFYETF